MRRSAALIGIASAMLLLASACGGGDDQTSVTPPATPASTPIATTVPTEDPTGGGGLTADVIASKLVNYDAGGGIGPMRGVSCTETTKEGESLHNFYCTATYYPPDRDAGIPAKIGVSESEDGTLLAVLGAEGWGYSIFPLY
jgi:hypothetical protein